MNKSYVYQPADTFNKPFQLQLKFYPTLIAVLSFDLQSPHSYLPASNLCGLHHNGDERHDDDGSRHG